MKILEVPMYFGWFNAKERAGEKISLFDLAKISVKLVMYSVLKSGKNVQ